MSRSSRTLVPLVAGAVVGATWQAIQRRGWLDLQGKVVLITGGSRGLGLVLAREFAAAGSRISICARDELELENAALELRSRGAQVLAMRCDISHQDEVEAWVRRTHEQFGAIDVLVNNASIIQVGPVEAMTIADFEEVMAVNFWGLVYATFAVLPHMRIRQRGRIANITSIGAKVSLPHHLPYSSAKFAAAGFSEGMRAELAKDGIRVSTIVPGLLRTGSPANTFFKGNQEAEYAWFSLAAATPLTAMSARRAARRIIRAIRAGEAEVTLTWQAKLLRLAHDLFPGPVSGITGVVNRALPKNQPGGLRKVRGMKLATRASPSIVTSLMNRAARRNNEYGGRPKPSRAHARKVGIDRGFDR